ARAKAPRSASAISPRPTSTSAPSACSPRSSRSASSTVWFAASCRAGDARAASSVWRWPRAYPPGVAPRPQALPQNASRRHRVPRRRLGNDHFPRAALGLVAGAALMTPLRVLHVIPSVSPRDGGPTRAIDIIERALCQAGVEVATLTTDHDVDFWGGPRA